MLNKFSADSIKKRINTKLEDNPELLYHIDNPFLQKYIDIVIDSICEEVARAPEETMQELNNGLQKAMRSRF